MSCSWSSSFLDTRLLALLSRTQGNTSLPCINSVVCLAIWIPLNTYGQTLPNNGEKRKLITPFFVWQNYFLPLHIALSFSFSGQARVTSGFPRSSLPSQSPDPSHGTPYEGMSPSFPTRKKPTIGQFANYSMICFQLGFNISSPSAVLFGFC